MSEAVCPPSHAPILDDEIAWVVITLHRDGMGQVRAEAVHLRDEGEAHQIATLVSRHGPTWMLGIGFDECRSARYSDDAKGGGG